MREGQYEKNNNPFNLADGNESSVGKWSRLEVGNSPGRSQHSRAPGPANPQSQREDLGEGPGLAAGIKEKQGKQPEPCCSLSKDNGVLWGEENEHREI